MPSYGELLLLLVPVFGLIGAGAWLRRLQWLSTEADASLLKVVVNFLYPCLIFSNVLGNEALRQPGNLLLAPLVGFGTMLLGFAVAFYAGRALGFQKGTGLRTFAYVTGIYNYGYMAIPLMTALHGKQSLGVLLVHNVGCEVAIWTVGLLVLSGLSLREGWRKLLNPLVCTLFLAVGCNLSGLDAYVPAVAMTTIEMAAACAIPLGLLVIGATLEPYLTRPGELLAWKTSLASVGLRLGLLPVFFLLLAKFLPCPVELKQVIVVQAAMPSGILSIVVSKHFGGHTLTAVRVVVATTLVGLLAIPFWLKLGLAWVQ